MAEVQQDVGIHPSFHPHSRTYPARPAIHRQAKADGLVLRQHAPVEGVGGGEELAVGEALAGGAVGCVAAGDSCCQQQGQQRQQQASCLGKGALRLHRS